MAEFHTNNQPRSVTADIGPGHDSRFFQEATWSENQGLSTLRSPEFTAPHADQRHPAASPLPNADQPKATILPFPFFSTDDNPKIIPELDAGGKNTEKDRLPNPNKTIMVDPEIEKKKMTSVPPGAVVLQQEIPGPRAQVVLVYIYMMPIDKIS